MKPPHLTRAVVEAARRFEAAVYADDDAGVLISGAALADALSALDAAPEVEPRAWECLDCGRLVEANDGDDLAWRKAHPEAPCSGCGGTLTPLYRGGRDGEA